MNKDWTIEEIFELAKSVGFVLFERKYSGNPDEQLIMVNGYTEETETHSLNELLEMKRSLGR